MKRIHLNAMSASLGFALLLGANVAPAQVTTSQDPTTLVGSDTLIDIMADVMAVVSLNGGPNGIATYSGLGSSAGERQLEGSPDLTAGEPFCLPTDANGGAEGNPGCQEISPMSRAMDSSICEDDNAATNGEGLAICRDGIVIVANNAGHQQFATGTCPSPNPSPTPNTNNAFPDLGTGNLRNDGTLPNSGYVIGANLGAGNEWKDVVRLIYTGCSNTDGTCNASVARATRCNSAVRQELVSAWANLFEGIDCGTGACTSLRRAYRRDDASGTTQVFLELLGVGVSLGGRSAVFSGIVPALTAIPTNHSFCDGGQLEGFLPDSGGTRGDPIKTACADNEDLCGPDGTLGLVRAVRNPLAGGAGGYPTNHCTRGLFDRVQWMSTSLPVCPDGSSPSAGRCRLPYYNNGGVKDFNCLNDRRNRFSTTPGVDGRAYNFVVRESDGTVANIATNWPETASWRVDMAQTYFSLSGLGLTGGPFPASDLRCQQSGATSIIGCAVAQTPCSFGFAGREAATIAPYDAAQEPVRLQGFGPSNADISAFQYPFARELFVNALNGFENITADCLARGGHPDYCADEVTLAQEFYDHTAVVQNACSDNGFIPLTDSQCVGTQGSAGCGRPTSQAKSACLPL